MSETERTRIKKDIALFEESIVELDSLSLQTLGKLEIKMLRKMVMRKRW
jgi:hypothetical protein